MADNVLKMNNAFRALTSQLVSRAILATRIGKTYGENRDLYKVLGYKRELNFEDFQARYYRGGLAGRIVDAFPSATWRNKPKLVTKDPKFNEEWTRLVNRLSLYHYFERADRISGIGAYGILVIGVKDGKPLSSPLTTVKSADDILFLTPYSQGSADIKALDENPTSPRFGLPLIYTVKPQIETINRRLLTSAYDVHHTRVIHIAENLVENPVLGIPRLERTWNYLDDLDKISGGSSEAMWRTVDRGVQFDLDKDADLDKADAEQMATEIDEYIHGFRRVLKTQGVTANVLDSTIADPRGNFEIIISLIAGTTGIPQRVLLGSEQGQMASNQDERNFNGRVKERQQSYAEPLILRQFVDKMAKIGALPQVEYEVHWPDISTMTAREKADVAARVAQALSNASNQPGITTPIIGADEFDRRFLDFGPDKLAQGPEDPNTEQTETIEQPITGGATNDK